MIDLTPLDVRKKRGDFPKALRGYEPSEVDTFLELVAERLEEVVKENMTLRERSERLAEQVNAQSGREKAVQDALVTAQELRTEIRQSAERESDLLLREGEAEARRMREEAEKASRTMIADAESRARQMLIEAERSLRERQDMLTELERRRTRFLQGFRQLLEREMDVCEVEENRSPLDPIEIDLDLLGGRPRVGTAQGPEDRPRLVSDHDPTDRPADAVDVHEMARFAASIGVDADPEPDPAREDDAVELELGGAATGGEPGAEAEDDDDWLNEILDDEAERAERGKEEGER